MGETIEQIEAHIENTREDLGANLRELEQRVDAATDWKHHFRARPLLMLGAAFAGGVLAAAAASGGRPRRGTTGINASSAPDALGSRWRPERQGPRHLGQHQGRADGCPHHAFHELRR